MKRTHFTLLILLLSFTGLAGDYQINTATFSVSSYTNTKCYRWIIESDDHKNAAYLECDSEEWCIDDPQGAIKTLIKNLEYDIKLIDSLRNYIYDHAPSKTRTRFEPLKGNV